MRKPLKLKPLFMWLILLLNLAKLNSAQFQTRGEVAISEGAIIGTRKILESSIIPGKNLDSPISIIDGNEGSYFQLHVTKSQDNSRVSYIHLETRKKLDRELTPNFDLNITNGQGYLNLRVDILDINDNPPIFQQSEYKVNVNESVSIGTSLVQVTAQDPDEGKNSLLSYSIANQELSEVFKIDAKTGLISVRKSLRCDCLICLKEDKVCSLVIVATDGGQPRQSSQTVVKVELLDTNDHDPRISFKVLPDQSQDYASVNERAKVGTSVAAITVTDLDKGSHGSTELEIIEGNNLEHFELQAIPKSSLYVLRVSSRARFTRGSQYNLTLEAQDYGIPSRSSRKVLVVKVKEVNEHKPSFDQDKYFIEISESVLPGTSVMVVQADDQDPNADLTYEILQPLISSFKIQSKSGLVTTKTNLDREAEDRVQLKIRVSDGSHEAFTELNVEIKDVNDEVPTFDKEEYEFQVEENFPLRQVFGRVVAQDNDLGPSGQVEYKIIGIHQDTFAINKVTGELFPLAILDWEMKSEYLIRVQANDKGNEKQLSSTVNVRIIIKDLNDNIPIFYPVTYFLDMSEKSEEQLIATDPDENSNITYDLEISELEFELDEQLGYFQINQRYASLIRSEGKIRELKVFGTDNEGQKSQDPARIFVYPRNTLRNQLFQGDKTFELVEDSQLRDALVGRKVGQVPITIQAILEITSGDPFGYFEVDNEGQIQTRKAIDREQTDEFNLVITGRNDNGFDEMNVKINVIDINDNLPSFDMNDPDMLEVDIRSPVGHQIHRVKCTDPDQDKNGQLQFMLDSNDKVVIDSETGIISLRSALTTLESFEITVKVNDLGQEALSNLKSYYVQVISSENDYTPMFDFELYEVSLSELTPLNTEVITMSAIDEDQDDTISYAIIDNNREDKFDILPDGKVYLVDKLDRESKAYYSVIVTATDNGLVPFARSSTSTLVIYVTDENDNAPILEKNEYVFYLKENSEADTVIGRVSAYDLDLGRNAEIAYKFATDNDLFKIDKQSGFVSSRVSIDRENMQTSSFDLEVIVSDLGLVPQTSSATVLISILDENDNKPEFSQENYQSTISESANLGSEVISVLARDLDAEENGRVLYSIIDDDSGVFKIDEISGKIYLQSQLDRESVDQYEIIVQAHDLGSPSLTSTCMVHVNVLDENDNTPVFPDKKIELKLSEDANVGDMIYEFMANDQDLGQNGKLSYFLAGNNLNGFSINSESGVMTIASQLDREKRDHVDMVVSAVDNGVYPKTGTVMVSIDITDVNDNAPVIQTLTSVINVKEGIPVGTTITKIDAKDQDIGPNGAIMFEIKTGQDTFKINEKTGEINTKVEIDREVRDKYELLIKVSDKGFPKSLSVEKTFTVNVEDINDNAPVITSLNTALMISGSPRGTPIMRVQAEDADTSSNAAITYKLREPSNQVKLDPISGELILIQDFSQDTQEPLLLNVIVSDGAVPSVRKSSSATITIIPGRAKPGLSFTTELYEATLSENSPIGTPVITTALNGDAEDRVQYFVVECESKRGKGRGLFEVDKYTGQVMTTTELDREIEGSTIILHVIALIGNDQMSGTKVKINLQDENDSAPKFDDNFDIVLSEAFLPGHNIGYAKATDPDMNSILTYSLGLSTQNFLNIDAQSGEVTLTSSIDRELLAQLEVIIMASDGLHTTEWKKLVPIKDINDNAPNFITPEFSFDILENVERGAFVGKIEAQDQDENEKLTYSFISDWGLDTFSIDPASGIISLSGNALDHESIEHYILTVSASDSGNPVLTATSTVYVNVKDINDNPPVIEKSLYEVNIAEDVAIGSSVIDIVANDKDSDENTDLQFSLENSIANVFDILSNGTIVTKSRLDRESISFYSFEVKVADSANTQIQLVSSCVVQVTIQDVNDQVPLFENIEKLEIVENSPPNTPVAAIRAIDKDLGKNSEIEYLLEDSLGGKFSIGRIDGVLRSVKSLDREEQDIYQLSVTAIDNGSPRLSSRVEIAVNVVDINDNPPTFEQKQYSASILENVSIGMDILEASAFDLDVGNNGKLRFTIVSGDPRGDFEINEANGILRVAKRLDHERQNSYKLILQVQDSGSEPRFDTAEVSILVTDTNDNAPDFENSPFTVRVIEEMELLDPIFTVEARDRDTSVAFNEIEYSIRAGGLHDDLFHLNGSTGQIFVKTKLDREKTEKMTLEILALDSGSPRLTGTGTLYVIVEDVNDHRPIFENDVYEFSIKENVPKNSQVGQIEALDKDKDENGKIEYSLIGTEFFTINNQGVILTSENLDREAQVYHEFQVLASDSSKIQKLSNKAKIVVEILDENDNRPTFDNNQTDFFIPPGLKSGDFVLGLFASDLDSGQKLTFSLNGKDARMFNINRNNGVVTASDSFQDKKSFDITVTVSDSSLRRDSRLNIYLAEELVVPKFDDGSTPPEVNVDEDAEIGTSLVTFRALGDLNEAVKYSIAGGNLGNIFDVDAMTGVVKINQTLDYETYDRYDLWIKTFYETRPLFSAAKKISVVISDKNDNAPHFESSLVKADIPEGLYPPFDIAEVFAYDPDTGSNGEITYKLIENEENQFEIDAKSGLIKCNKQLDREVLDRYTLKVVAEDNGFPKKLSSTATILLRVQDVNDNPPRFTRLHSINVTENTAIGTNLLKIETVDKDSYENAQVKFKFINNPDEAFAIHETLGNISINRNLDREIRDEYSLKVQASDGLWNIDTVITVTVQDANDNEPIFDQKIYNFDLVQGLPIIGKVHALDRDSVGPNSEVTYELSHVSDFFEIEEFSGEIKAKSDLKAKTATDSYSLRVIVKDGGSPPMSSECQVIVNIKNSENSSPKFTENFPQEIGVPKSIPVGTKILSLNATDADPEDELRYLIDSEIFKVVDSNLVIGRSLQNLEYSKFELDIQVIDNQNASDTKSCNIIITDDNKFSPEFQAPTSRIYIREDETVGNVIITLKATDQDQDINGQIEYEIVKGDPGKMFKIDKQTGSISVNQALDYEEIPVYNILIQAKDRGFYSKSSTSSVKIILQDVNDNPPIFEQNLYEAKLLENSPSGTFVTQMIAEDLDSPKNAEIVYNIIDQNDKDFEIDPQTGIVKALRSFDYELIDVIILKIRASNPQNDQDQAMTLLKINIIGVNEFFPRFKQAVSQFTISESAQESSLVGQVEAIDSDAGKDGEVFYYFVGSSNEAGFKIDKKTGVIQVKGNLDRESQDRYVLTVLAKNRGSIKGNDTDEAQIIIQVQDGNDPPVFRKDLYKAEISEASQKGTKVTQVSAVDKDVRPRNSQFVYVIADGNLNNSFTIGPNTGDILVENDLDRELVPFFNLTIQAVDNGSPPAIGQTFVLIKILDINDSPPKLEITEAYIKENSPPNSFVTQLTASDPDLPPNAEPFKFKLLNANSMFELDPNSGVLTTKNTIDREEFDNFDLNIEVQDAGGLKTKSNLRVDVGDENDNPSKPRNVQVIIKNFEGTFPGGIILNVRPDDPDIKGNYNCQLISGPDNIFIVNQDCSVKAGRIHNGREYDLDIKINDGKHEDVRVQTKLNFVSFSEFAVEESVSLRFRNVPAQDVLEFFEQNVSNNNNRLIELLSLNILDENTVECFVASRENDLFLPKEETIDHLDNMKINLPVIIDYDPCDENPCLHNGKCSKKSIVLKQTEITESQNTIFNSPVLLQNVTCECQPEYNGDKCQSQKNPCIPNPCQDNGQCFQQGDTFRCLCPPLRGGKTCEIEKTNACLPNPCLNGGSCQNAKNNGFFCLCRPGYQGELCQTIIDTCRQNPCLNGGTCISLNPNYKCRCHDHFYGNHCEHSTYGFEEFSFATFPPLDANTNDISVIFATSKSNSLMVYNFGKAAGGRSDFLSLELVNGHPRFSWGGSRTAITRLSLTNKKVDTGRWYKVTATRNNRVASLSVEDCAESGDHCKSCRPDDPRCFTKEVGEAGTLVFHKNPMFFGGINDESSIIDRPGQLEALDFVGCIRSISINGNEKNLLSESLNKTGLKDTCNFAESGSCSRGDECGSTGTCIPLWSHHKCKCGFNEILALDCGPSFEPFTLTEGQEVYFKPTRLFRHATRLHLDSKWKRDLNSKSLSITFRTLTSNSQLLKALNNGLAYTQLVIKEDGILEYRSKSNLGSSNEIILDTEVTVNDGSWHTATIEVTGNVLHFLLDNVQVGFEVEFSAVHNFMDSNLKSMTIGGSNFRGCVTNFTLANELQSLKGSKQLLEADYSPLIHLNGCDVEILRVAQPQTALDVGVTVAISFFVALLFIMAISYLVFKTRGRFSSGKIQNSKQISGQNNQSFDLQENQPPILNNSRPGNLQPTSKPDIIEAESRVGGRFDQFDAAEHYDIENASSIAPSDIDIVYHYKGYREGHHRTGHRSLPKKKGRQNLNTPLARLSPSSEMSHNTPRILTLKDLSGKPLPPSLLTEQSERSLNSPVHSHFSSSSRQMRSGLTSENVARFNNAQRSTTPKNTSTLVNTLDLVSMGSGSRKKVNKTPTSNIVGSGSTTTSNSSDEDNDDDSFTCSEYECDSNKLDNGVNEPMNFSKLMDLGPVAARPSSSRRRYRTSDEDEDDYERPPRPDSRSWENLLTWWPDYESFAGVFKDIAELPHLNLNAENDVCRPPPLGEHHDSEEYI